MRSHLKAISLALTAAWLVSCGNSADSAPEVKTQLSSSGQTAQVIPAAAKAELTPMERGAKLFKRCKACHTLEDGGRNKVGPNLWDIWGNKAASREGFAYSKALIAADITWNDETFDAYIKKPNAFVPGTRMSFVGIKKDQDRADLLLYLKAETTP